MPGCTAAFPHGETHDALAIVRAQVLILRSPSLDHLHIQQHINEKFLLHRAVDANAGFTAQQKTMLATWLTEIMLDRMNKLQDKPQELAQVPGRVLHIVDDMIVPTGIVPNTASLRCQAHLA